MSRKILICLVMCFILLLPLATAKQVKHFSGFKGVLDSSAKDANFATNWGDGEVPLTGVMPRKSLAKTTDSHLPTRKSYSKSTKMVPRTAHRKTKINMEKDCTPGEYRLTNYRNGKYFGVEKCVSGNLFPEWRKI